ncbi:unnamed protein product [Gordionus sp. m RMFG-2023]
MQSLAMLPKVVTYFLDSTMENIALLCCTKGVSIDSKVISMLYAIFPHARENIASEFKMVRWDRFEEFFHVPAKIPDQAYLAGIDTRLQAIMTICVLSFSYTRTQRINQQISKRAQAAAAGSPYKPITENEISEVLTAVGIDVTQSSPNIDEALGYVLAVRKDGTYDPLVTEINSMGVDDFRKSGDISEWSVKLFEQAKMIYKKYHGGTIRMGTAVLPILKDYMDGLGAEWIQEYKHLATISPILRASPYIGLQRILPDNFRVITAPRICYIGVLYKVRLPRMNSIIM